MGKQNQSPMYANLELAPEVKKTLEQLRNEEESLSKQKFGRRVSLEKTAKRVGISAITEIHTCEFCDGGSITEKCFTHTDPVVSGKEPTLFKIGKEPNQYKTREAS